MTRDNKAARLDALTALVSQMCEANARFAESVRSTLVTISPTLERIRQLCAEVAVYEDNEISQWEDEMYDFWRNGTDTDINRW